MSDVPWTVPASWLWVSMGEISAVVGGGTPTTNDAANFGGSIPWITPADMTRHVGKYIRQGARFITDKGLADSGARWLPEGSVLFSSRAPIGYTAIAAQPVTTNQGFKSFALETGIRPDFVYHWLSSAKRMAEGMASGTTFLELSGAKAAQLPMPLPPAAEQTRIVEKLEELLSDLDAGVAELKAAQAKLQHYRQSLLKAAVEGSLTRAWREAHPAPEETGAALLARILRERRARWEAQQLAKFEARGKVPTKGWREAYTEPTEPNAADMPSLPAGWTWASAEQLCTFITKGTTPPKGQDTAGDKTIPFLRVTNLTNRGVLDLTDKVFVSNATHQGFLARSRVVPGDVLMNIVGPPLGQVALVPGSSPEWNINQAIAIFRAVDGVLPDFICCYLLSPIAQRWLKARAKTTAGQTNLTLEICRQLPIPLAPMGEQQAVVNALAEQLGSLDTLEDAVPAAERQSTAQRQNLLRAAFAGQLVPQDPADEPAAALLARIRAERAAAQPAAKRSRSTKVTA